MRRLSVLTIIVLMVMASCRERGATLPLGGGADSLADDTIVLAMVPVMETLPVYYADALGLFDSAGLKVKVVSMTSAMDVDTALANGVATIGYTYLPRLMEMERRGVDTLGPIAMIGERFSLMTARSKRIRRLPQLKTRMVALERYSTSDYWSDLLCEEAKLERSDVFRPQINDFSLRASMLVGTLVDAAFLPEPYATQAMLSGKVRRLWQVPDSVQSFACLASRRHCGTDSLLLSVVALAVDSLNENPRMGLVGDILMRDYAIGQDIVDTIPMPRFEPFTQPDEATAGRVRAWLTKRWEK